jgi:hypothetical protein
VGRADRILAELRLWAAGNTSLASSPDFTTDISYKVRDFLTADKTPARPLRFASATDIAHPLRRDFVVPYATLCRSGSAASPGIDRTIITQDVTTVDTPRKDCDDGNPRCA